jgi:regulator of sigma E protease
MILAVVAIIFTLLLVVGIHEAGHALVAWFFQVKIQKISIGFGRALLSWRSRSGCDWVFAMWPLGGYVQLLNTRISPVPKKEQVFCFDKKPIWIRVLILLAGPVFNLIMAWLLFVLVFSLGISYRVPQIASVQANSIAAQAGVQAGDRLISINEHITSSWQDVGMELLFSWGKKEVPVVLRQSNQELKKIRLDLSKVSLNPSVKSLFGNLGIQVNINAPREMIRYPSIIEAVGHTNALITHLLYFFIMVLKQLFTANIPFSVLLGPVGLFAASTTSLMQGIMVFLFFIASFSLAVGFMNSFPIPGLDGGSILYCIVEKIRKKPISIAWEVLLYQLTLIALFLLLVQLIKNDLFRLFLSYR